MKKNSYVNSGFGGENASRTNRDEAFIFMVCTNYRSRDYIKSILEIFDQVDFSLFSRFTLLSERSEKGGGGPTIIEYQLPRVGKKF
jgi:hypothetical protein